MILFQVTTWVRPCGTITASAGFRSSLFLPELTGITFPILPEVMAIHVNSGAACLGIAQTPFISQLHCF